MRRFLNFMCITMTFLLGGMLYAYVYDVEPFTQEKHYQMERDVYYRSVDAGYGDFPSYSQWVAEQETREMLFRDYVHELVRELGLEFADTCEWAVGKERPYRSNRENGEHYEEPPVSAEQYARDRGPD